MRWIGGVLLGWILAAAALALCLALGRIPVAVADNPLPAERWIAQIPLQARIAHEIVKKPPVEPDEFNLLAGARVYRDQCATCHGFHGRAVELGNRLYPAAPPLWETHRHGADTVVGVSDDPPGATQWKVTNGIRLTGMPTYKNLLTENEIWQVSVLLANAGKPLPPGALILLRGGSLSAPPAPATTPAARK